jgi:hypothetical protein
MESSNFILFVSFVNVCSPQLRHFAVARQRARIWLQSYEKNIKPVPFSVGIDVFSVSSQRLIAHHSLLKGMNTVHAWLQLHRGC